VRMCACLIHREGENKIETFRENERVRMCACLSHRKGENKIETCRENESVRMCACLSDGKADYAAPHHHQVILGSSPQLPVKKRGHQSSS
jgi:hypothetical protein